jgi:hypothetical protein
MGNMNESEHRPEAETELGDKPDTELLQDEQEAEALQAEEETEESMEEVRSLIVGEHLAALEQRIAFLETRLDIEVAEVRRSVVRSTELLMEVLRQEIRDLASRLEAGTPRHSEAMERFWAVAALDDEEEC